MPAPGAIENGHSAADSGKKIRKMKTSPVAPDFEKKKKKKEKKVEAEAVNGGGAEGKVSKKMKRAKSPEDDGAAAKKMIADPRFARVQTDPRFMRMPKNKTKVSIDKRFSHMFSDKNFSDPLGADKRGRANKKTGANKKKEKHTLQRYYNVDEDQDDSEEDDDASSDSDEEPSSSSSSSSSESEAEEDLDDPRNEEKVPTAPGAETRRFAMMNMDWEHIKAVDLLMLMRSFQPKAGRIERVTVYPSEFGIEQMKAEQVHGPNMIFEDNDDEEDEDKEVSMEKLRAYEKNKLKYYYAVVECDSKETANHLYTQCDGMEFERTSNTLDLRFIPDNMTFVRDPRDVAEEVQDGYKAPEFETRALQHSTVKLTWDDDEPTRVKALRKKFNADELNEMDFRAYLASESSEEELAVDDDEDESPSSPERGDASNGEGTESKKDKYRSLLLGDSAEEVELPGQKAKKGDVDMEVTFHTGLTELSEKLMQRKEAKKRGDETVWEAYLRKKKEKKAQKKRSKNAKSDDDDDDYSGEDVAASPRMGQGDVDPFFANNENGFDDPFFAEDAEFLDDSKAAPKKLSKTKSKDSERLKKREEKEQQKKEEEKSKAELELLLMDDDGVQDAARGFNLKSKKDKKRKDKGKKKKGAKLDGDQEEEEDKLATADLTDPRFAPLFSNHHFAIDPTNPQFRKSAAQLKILAESQRRRVQKSADSTPANDLNPDAIDAALGFSQDRKRKAEISSLVRSLKRKAGKPGSARNN